MKLWLLLAACADSPNVGEVAVGGGASLQPVVESTDDDVDTINEVVAGGSAEAPSAVDGKAACNDFLVRGFDESTHEVHRFEVSTAADVSTWQEQRDAVDGVPRRTSLFADMPTDAPVIVCLIWGEIPAPGPPPNVVPDFEGYDASIWLICGDNEARLDTAGTQTTLSEMPSDFFAGQ